MVTIRQMREARELLGWGSAALSREARVEYTSLVRAQLLPDEQPVPDEIAAGVKKAFEAAGVEFTNGDDPGVKLRKPA